MNILFKLISPVSTLPLSAWVEKKRNKNEALMFFH